MGGELLTGGEVASVVVIVVGVVVSSVGIRVVVAGCVVGGGNCARKHSVATQPDALMCSIH